MKLLVYIALVLGPLLVAASLDAIPDPPAVNPHTVDVRASTLCQAPPASEEQRCQDGALFFASHHVFRGVGLAGKTETIRYCDDVALTRSAGDPSPPASFRIYA